MYIFLFLFLFIYYSSCRNTKWKILIYGTGSLERARGSGCVTAANGNGRIMLYYNILLTIVVCFEIIGVCVKHKTTTAIAGRGLGGVPGGGEMIYGPDRRGTSSSAADGGFSRNPRADTTAVV